MSSRAPLPLDWLGPTLDACRGIVTAGVHQFQDKPSEGGRETVTDVDIQIERTLTTAIHERVPSATILTEPGFTDEVGAGRT